jgi:hypothetical protein
MKQYIFSLLILFIGFSAFTQNEKYVNMMKASIEKINYNNSSEEIIKAANQMERVANVEKSEWLPAYYSTIAYVTLASKDMEKGGEKIQEYVDKAKESLAKAQAIAPEDSEVLTAQAYVSIAHIWLNPMANGAKYSMQAYQEFDKAMEANPDNPRPYYLKAQNIFFTPAAFGGGKEKAKELFMIAKEKFDAFEPASEIAPDWGKEANAYFIGLCEAE